MNLERQIEIKNEYLGFILDLAYDYDVFNTVEGLKGLIDGLSKYARYALDNNDKIPIYRNTNGDDFKDITNAIFGNVKEELKFYLSNYKTLEEFRKANLKEND